MNPMTKQWNELSAPYMEEKLEWDRSIGAAPLECEVIDEEEYEHISELKREQDKIRREIRKINDKWANRSMMVMEAKEEGSVTEDEAVEMLEHLVKEREQTIAKTIMEGQYQTKLEREETQQNLILDVFDE